MNTLDTIRPQARLDAEAASDNNGLRSFCFPNKAPARPQRNALTLFQVLLKTATGKIVWFEYKAKQPPQADYLYRLSDAIDGFDLKDERSAAKALPFIEYHFDLSFIQGNFLDHSRWHLQSCLNQDVIDIVSQTHDHTGLEAIRTEVYRLGTALFDQGLSEFKSALDPDILHCLSHSNMLTIQLYNLLWADGGSHRTYRTQAIKAYPFLADLLSSERYDGIKKTIDQGLPLTEALAKQFDVAPGVIRKLGRQHISMLQSPLNTPECLIPLLSHIPLDKIPQSASAWQEFNDLSNKITQFIRQPINTPLGQSLLVDCLSSRQSHQLVMETDWQLQQHAIQQFLYAFTSIIRMIFAPHMVHSIADIKATSAIGQIITLLGLKQVIRWSQSWGQAFREVEAFYAEDNQLLRGELWPTLLTEPIAFESYVFHPLETPAALAAEGQAMSNCVASYASDCRIGSCQIWSITGLDHLRLATLQTHIDYPAAANQVSISIGQLEGPDNTSASSAIRFAAEKFTQHLSGQTQLLRIYRDQLKKRKAYSYSDRMELALSRSLILALRRTLPDKMDLNSLFEKLSQPHFSHERFAQLQGAEIKLSV